MRRQMSRWQCRRSGDDQPGRRRRLFFVFQPLLETGTWSRQQLLGSGCHLYQPLLVRGLGLLTNPLWSPRRRLRRRALRGHGVQSAGLLDTYSFFIHVILLPIIIMLFLYVRYKCFFILCVKYLYLFFSFHAGKFFFT